MLKEMGDKSLKPIVFKTAKGFVYFNYAEIIVCSAEGNNSLVFTTNSNTPLKILHNISFIERKYCTDKFLRCHKSHIINLVHIKKLITKNHHIELNGSFIVPLSEECWRKIKNMSENNIQEI